MALAFIRSLYGLEDLADLIEQDPSLAGKLIAAANSALIRGRTEICSAEEALLRMGITRACTVVISLAVQEMVTHVYPLKQYQEALRTAGNRRKTGSVKVLLDPTLS